MGGKKYIRSLLGGGLGLALSRCKTKICVTLQCAYIARRNGWISQDVKYIYICMRIYIRIRMIRAYICMYVYIDTCRAASSNICMYIHTYIHMCCVLICPPILYITSSRCTRLHKLRPIEILLHKRTNPIRMYGHIYLCMNVLMPARQRHRMIAQGLADGIGVGLLFRYRGPF